MLTHLTEEVVDVLTGVSFVPKTITDGNLHVEIESVSIVYEAQTSDDIQLDTFIAVRKPKGIETMIKHDNFLIVVKGERI